MNNLKKLMLFTFILSSIMTFTSCQGLIDAIMGDHTDKPTTNPTEEPKTGSNVIDLSKLTSDYTAKEGDILTGKLTGNYRIIVPSGLNVTIKDVEIDIPDDDSHQWAGITCGTTSSSTRSENANTRGSSLNAVNLFLEGINKIKGGKGHPGIFVPQGNELVVKSKSNGSLEVGSNGQAAAIGGGFGLDCGNITLEGGIITAIGGAGAAAIGSGSGASCGAIIILGGKVTATGGAGGAGIGCGKNGSCVNIKVEATIIIAVGGSLAAGIGSGEGSESSCGDIIIADDADIDSTKGEGAVNDIGQGDPESECGDVINEKVVKEITLDKTTLSMSLGDQPVTLTATINPEEVADKTLIWSSSDEKVVTVDENGKVTAVDAGTATIKVMTEDESVFATCDVSVVVDLSTPLTFEAKVAGVTVKFNYEETAANVEYSINNGDWTALTSAGVTLTTAGDKVSFRGTNDSYCVSLPSYTRYQFSFSEKCYVYGNIMSLINKDSFATLTELSASYTFCSLFAGQSNIMHKDSDHELLLPATKLSSNCYNSMFSGCTGLTKAPNLPAKSLARECYAYMFNGCSSLEAAPELPATELKEMCYIRMFQGCTKLTTAPKMIVNSVASQCCLEMFQNCTALTTAPIELKATTLQDECYKEMFSYCRSLTAGPTELPATVLANFCYSGMFSECRKLTTAPNIMATTLADGCCEFMFANCQALTTAPELKATTLKLSCYHNMFQSCTSLTTAPTELPAATLANLCYEGMFSFCSNLTAAPVIKATTLSTGSCKLMFYNCTSLTTAPDLKATTLVDECYLNIFMGCSKLSSIVCLATNGFDTYLPLGNWLQDVGIDAASRTLHVKEGKAGEAWSVPTGTYNWTITDDK